MATLNEDQLMTNEKQVAAASINEKIKVYGETSNEVIVDRYVKDTIVSLGGAPDRRLWSVHTDSSIHCR